MIGLSHIAGLLAAATHLLWRQGRLSPSGPAPRTAPMARCISLESMLASGLAVSSVSGFRRCADFVEATRTRIVTR